MTLSYPDSRLQPLRTARDVEHRVAELIGGAARRQLWFLFVDENDVQLPLLMPVDEIDAWPLPDDREVLAACFADLVEAAEAAGIVIVLERPGGERLDAGDLEWARVLHGACSDASASLRGLLLAHDGGVRWMAQDDYGVAEPGGEHPAPGC